MEYNVDKCKVFYIGNNNQYTKCTMNGSKLSKVLHDKDLGVTISNQFKTTKHCSDVVKTVNKLVLLIGRTFEYKSKKVLRTLFNALIRPHLEYCVQFRSPYYKNYIDKLDIIQQRVSKIIPR